MQAEVANAAVRPASGPGPAAARVPPQDLVAERVVVSTILCHPEDLDTARGILTTPEMFYAPAHRLIFGAACALADAGLAVDSVSVSGKLRDDGQLGTAGGSPYIGELVGHIAFVANWEQHALRVRDMWRARAALQLHQERTAQAYATDFESVQTWLEETESALAEISGLSYQRDLVRVGDAFGTYVDALADARARGESIIGTPTGYKDLDTQTGGLYDGDLIIVAGRPGLGKTSLATGLATNIATPDASTGDGLGVAFFSLEMPREQLAMRVACAESRLDANRVRRGTLTSEEWSRLVAVIPKLSQLFFWIDDTPAITIQELRGKVRRLQRAIKAGKVPGCKRLALVVVDYLQLMTGVRLKGDTREREVASLSNGLKNTAKLLEVPVLALSQLNRGVEKKSVKDRRPELSDLRESGSIENDADAVWLLYRESYYDHKAGPEVELNVAKQRNGPMGVVHLHFERTCMAYRSIYSGESYDDIADGYDDQLDGV